MAESRRARVLGRTDEPIAGGNDGTTVPRVSHGPKVVGRRSPSARPPLPAAPVAHRATGRRDLELLREGDRSANVRTLQSLLNSRSQPAANLKVDGHFGPMTRAAVTAFQQQRGIRADGIVGELSWYELLVPPRPEKKGAVTRPDVALPPVLDLDLSEKFESVIKRTAPKLPGKLREEFEQLITPTSLGIAAATCVGLAASHVFPAVGGAIDIGLLMLGVAAFGWAAFGAAYEFADFLRLTATATTEPELDEAASRLARAITMIGVGAFAALIFKNAGRVGKKAPPQAAGGKGSVAAGPSAGPVKLAPSKPKATAPVPPKEPQKSLPSPVAGPAKPTRTESLNSQLDAMYTKAPAAKAEIDVLAGNVAEAVGGKVAPAPLKSRGRALEKAMEYEAKGGDAGNVKDIARNTIVVARSQHDKAAALLQRGGAKVKSIDPATDDLGYSGANAVVKTKAGIPAEIQINSPEMIYAKESPATARAILGDDTYNQIAARTGVPGGRGHQLYEEWRSLPAGDPRRDVIATESRAYYQHVRQAGGR